MQQSSRQVAYAFVAKETQPDNNDSFMEKRDLVKAAMRPKTTTDACMPFPRKTAAGCDYKVKSGSHEQENETDTLTNL